VIREAKVLHTSPDRSIINLPNFWYSFLIDRKPVFCNSFFKFATIHIAQIVDLALLRSIIFLIRALMLLAGI
jgi:hypothetical protein